MPDSKDAQSAAAAVLWQADIQRHKLSRATSAGNIASNIKSTLTQLGLDEGAPPDFLLTACFEAMPLICNLAVSLSCRRRATSCCRCWTSLACCSSCCCLASTSGCCMPLEILSVCVWDLLPLNEIVCLLNISCLRLVSSVCILLYIMILMRCRKR